MANYAEIKIAKLQAEVKRLKGQVATYYPKRMKEEPRVVAASRRLDKCDQSVPSRRQIISLIISESKTDLNKYPLGYFKKTKVQHYEDTIDACINFNTTVCEKNWTHKISPGWKMVYHFCSLCKDLFGGLEFHPIKNCPILDFMDKNPPPMEYIPTPISKGPSAASTSSAASPASAAPTASPASASPQSFAFTNGNLNMPSAPSTASSASAASPASPTQNFGFTNGNLNMPSATSTAPSASAVSPASPAQKFGFTNGNLNMPSAPSAASSASAASAASAIPAASPAQTFAFTSGNLNMPNEYTNCFVCDHPIDSSQYETHTDECQKKWTGNHDTQMINLN